MNEPRRLVLLLLTSVVISVSGCAGKLPFTNFQSGPGGSRVAFKDNSAASLNPNGNNSRVSTRGVSLGQRGTPEKTGFTSSLTSAVKRAGQSVSDKLAIKPKVIPANDPTSLTGETGPLNSELYLSVAKIYEQRGDFIKAKEQYQKALEVKPNDVKAQLSYARIHDRLEQFGAAERLYRQAADSHPDNATAQNDLGLCFARQSKLDLAVQAMTRAVQIKPEKKLYRNNLAAVLVETQRFPEAFEHLAAVHGPAIAHYNLGHFMVQRNQTEQATRHFSEAVQIDPSFAAAKRMLQQLATRPDQNRQSNHVQPKPSTVVEANSQSAPAATESFISDERNNESATNESSPSDTKITRTAYLVEERQPVVRPAVALQPEFAAEEDEQTTVTVAEQWLTDDPADEVSEPEEPALLPVVDAKEISTENADAYDDQSN